jgi:dTDP-L-rhamnose 4-epimerase
MSKKILVTGGAGFIGSHLTDELVRRGHRVRVFDNVEKQVHGNGANAPKHLNPEAEFVRGDVKDRKSLRKAVQDAEVIFHQAAAVGVGQSMYEVAKYCEVNVGGTANLLDILVHNGNKVEKIILASSMSNYGEGKYHCKQCGTVFPNLRSTDDLRRHQWEIRCPKCTQTINVLPTDEEKPLQPTSIYATTKRTQEEMVLNVGRAYGIPAVALRYFNIYGPRQSLSNPYTGVAAIFSSRIMNRQRPVIFEDGRQGRDFTHVSDVVQANILAMESDAADYQVFNVGTGRMTNLLELVEMLIERLEGGDGITPQFVNQFREGDIRYCFADIRKIEGTLGYRPKISFKQGVSDLIEWARNQNAADSFEAAAAELTRHGLTK